MPPSHSRRALLAAGSGLLGSIAGCSALTGSDTTETPTETLTGVPTTPSPTPEPLETLAVHGSKLAGVVQRAATEWNANDVHHGAGFNARFADGFAVRYGIDPTREASNPPFQVAPAKIDAESVATGLAEGHVDLGDTAPVAPGDLDVETPTLGEYRAYPVAVGGWKFVVSPAMAEAGVTELTFEQARGLFTGEVGNWREVGGPDREPYVLGVVEGDPRLPFKQRLFGDRPLTAIDQRIGQDRPRLERVAEREDVVSYVRVGIPTYDVPVPSLVIDGTAYPPAADAYPGTYPVPLYSWGEPDPREAAFLELLVSEYGQAVLVGNDWELMTLDGET
jgi:phosphate transport system substrate-binding protein